MRTTTQQRERTVTPEFQSPRVYYKELQRRHGINRIYRQFETSIAMGVVYKNQRPWISKKNGY